MASWSLQRFKPLIKAGGGTVFAELTLDGGVLEEVKLRQFFADSELAFDYTFDAAGKLTGLHGSVTVRSVGADDSGRDGAAGVCGLAGRGGVDAGS